MARGIHRLSPAKVHSLKRPGMYADGGNLWLRVKPGAEGVSKSWIFRFGLDGREHLMGLGPVRDRTLAEARERAAQARKLLLDGVSPLENKRQQAAERRVASLPVVTFQQAAAEYIATHEASWRSAKHSAEWVRTLARSFPLLGPLQPKDITVDLVLQVLRPIWLETPETASRLRGRIEMVLDACAARGLRDGANPAALKVLKHLLPKTAKLNGGKKHFEALPYSELPGFMARLRKVEGMPARALEFLILCAARAGEVRFAKFSEIKGETWEIPGSRTKSGRQQNVPLSPRAREILDELPRTASEAIFPGHGGQGGLRKVLARMDVDCTVHGFRSSFRDWCGNRAVPRDIAELCLAHRIGDATEQSYLRTDYLEARKKVMDAWCRYCASPQAEGKVLRGRFPRSR